MRRFEFQGGLMILFLACAETELRPPGRRNHHLTEVQVLIPLQRGVHASSAFRILCPACRRLGRAIRLPHPNTLRMISDRSKPGHLSQPSLHPSRRLNALPCQASLRIRSP